MVTSEEMLDIIDTLSSWTGIRLTVEQFDALVSEYDPELYKEIEEFGFDTVVREQMSNILSRSLIGRDWLTYGENIDPEEFFSDIIEAAKAIGYIVESV